MTINPLTRFAFAHDLSRWERYYFIYGQECPSDFADILVQAPSLCSLRHFDYSPIANL